MAWYNINGKDNDVVISSRIRFARNLADYPFCGVINAEKSKEVINKFKETAGDEYKFINFTDVKPIEAMSYVEKHYVSPEFASADNPRALLLDEDRGIAAMICEEDHIRLQCIKAGLSLNEAYESACEADDKICSPLNLAFDDRLGYLTHCPTNLGTAMRASVMMFLPALTTSGKLAQLSGYLPKVGYTIRGIYGEGSEADGFMYQVSNRVTLGLTEEEIVSKLAEVTSQIMEMERKERDAIHSSGAELYEDKIMRSYGVLKYAKLQTSGEFMKLQSNIRLGIAMGIITDIDAAKLNELMVSTSPATLAIANGGSLGEIERDRARAKAVNAALSGQKVVQDES